MAAARRATPLQRVNGTALQLYGAHTRTADCELVADEVLGAAVDAMVCAGAGPCRFPHPGYG
ncbi:hypothetical protein ACFTZJ_28080 [Streptomyces globisporus]|uniref:hypothetical protein n=1 Tax=Streptomyces globisporus TaxID=1908 RepID=UPI00362CF6C7